MTNVDWNAIALSLISGFAGSVLGIAGAWLLQRDAEQRNLRAVRGQMLALMRAVEARMKTTAAEPKLDLAKDVFDLWDTLFRIALSPEGAHAVAGTKSVFDDLVGLARVRLIIDNQRQTRDYYSRAAEAAKFQAAYENQLRQNGVYFADVLERCRRTLGDRLKVDIEQNVIDAKRQSGAPSEVK